MMRRPGQQPVTVGILLHLDRQTQIYCDRHGDHPPAIVLGAEPADCVISTAGIEAEPADLIAAERLLQAVTEYRDHLRSQVTRRGAAVGDERQGEGAHAVRAA
jgi:hypothetical protein